MAFFINENCIMDIEVNYFHHLTSEEKLEKYGYGEWVEEEDERRFIYNKIPCFILRSKLGNLCGYCRLPENHPWRLSCEFLQIRMDWILFRQFI